VLISCLVEVCLRLLEMGLLGGCSSVMTEEEILGCFKPQFVEGE
jgi:hypothetical protein